jgi:hypothetical protein
VLQLISQLLNPVPVPATASNNNEKA